MDGLEAPLAVVDREAVNLGRTLDLSVVILSYNVRDLLSLAIRTSLAASRDLAAEIIVVDNASPDGSADMVEETFPEVKLIRSDENLGFAGGNNLGLKTARGRHVMILNPDVVVHPRAFRSLVSYLDTHPETGAVGGRIINPDGTSDPGAKRGFPSPSAAFYRLVGLSYIFPRSRRFAGYNLTYMSPDEASDEVEALSGAFMCVRGEAFDEVGGLDDDYFMYGEDLDWCYRIRSAGWKIAYVPEAQIVHFRGQSTRTIPRLRQLYLFHQAMHIFVKKHIAPKSSGLFVAFMEAGIFARGLMVTAWRLAMAAVAPALDTAVVLASLVLAIALRTLTGWTLPMFSLEEWSLVGLVFVLSSVAGTLLTGLHGRRIMETRRASMFILLGTMLSVTAIFFIRSINFSRIVTGLTWFIAGGGILGWRALARWKLHAPAARGIVLGCGEQARVFLRALGETDPSYTIVGLIRGDADDASCDSVEGYPVLGHADDLQILLRRMKIDDLILTWDERDQFSDVLAHIRTSRKYVSRVRFVAGPVSSAPTDGGIVAALPEIELSLTKHRWF